MSEKLAGILEQARKDSSVRAKFLETKKAKDPMEEFCKVAASIGYDITVGELFAIGEEYTSNLLKSCNGGAVYPLDEWGDWYEDFLSALE